MTLEELTQELWLASDLKQSCRIQLEGEPLPRTIHPYGICTTTKNQIVLVCWQTMGFTKAGAKEGYRNLHLERVQEFERLDAHFRVREDFNPKDGQYKEWVYHV